MATKQENRALAVQLVEELGLDIAVPAVEKLNATKWAEMVSDLKAKKRDAEKVTLADVPAPVVVETPEVPKAAQYYIMPGCAITSRTKGILASPKGAALKDCTVVEPSWLNGGVATLEERVKSGHIGKR